jgi:ribose/xylose/arabinose/galactoside ABC-type transport system permease subunit
MSDRAALAGKAAARRRRVPEESGIFAVLVVVALGLSLISPSFRTVSNSFVLLVNGAVIMLLALGQSFVLLTGGIDLSTGANIAMTGVIAALLMKFGLPWPVASVLALAAATLLGVINGALTHFLKIPAFIATFSTQGVALAIPLIITGAQSISVHDFGFSWIGQGKVLGLPAPVALVIVAAVAAAFFLRMTRLGVHIYALGGNRAAARLSGVDVARTTLVVYGVSGFCAGVGGLIATSRLMVGFPRRRLRRNGSSKSLIVLATRYTSVSPISKWAPRFSGEADLARPSNILSAFFDFPPRRGIAETRFITIRMTARRSGRCWLGRFGYRVSRTKRSRRLASAWKSCMIRITRSFFAGYCFTASAESRR